MLNEAGLVLSKLNSVKQVKRPRDAFDIFFTLSGQNGEETATTITSMSREVVEVADQLNGFRNWLAGKANVFDDNVRKYAPSVSSNPSAFVRALLIP